MQLSLVINNEQKILDNKPDEMLLDVLRRERFISVKSGCRSGRCGCCTVLIDDRPCPSCIIPAAAVRGSHIITLEYFSKTDIYSDIMRGFERAGIHMCGYCNAGKIFAAYSLITMGNMDLDRDIIQNEISTLSCQCTEQTLLTNGILFAASLYLQRKGRAVNG